MFLIATLNQRSLEEAHQSHIEPALGTGMLDVVQSICLRVSWNLSMENQQGSLTCPL